MDLSVLQTCGEHPINSSRKYILLKHIWNALQHRPYIRTQNKCFCQLGCLVSCSLWFLAGLSIMTIFANSVMLSKSILLALGTFQALTLTLTSRLCLNFKPCLFYFGYRMDSAPVPSTEVTLVICISSFGCKILRGLAFAIQGWCTFQLVVSVPLFVIFLSLRNKLSLSLRGSWNERCMESAYVDSV